MPLWCWCSKRRASSSMARTLRSSERRPDLRAVAIDEQELVDSVGSRRQQVAPEAERVAVPGVETGDGPPAHHG